MVTQFQNSDRESARWILHKPGKLMSHVDALSSNRLLMPFLSVDFGVKKISLLHRGQIRRFQKSRIGY